MKRGITGAALCFMASQATWAQLPSFDNFDADGNGFLTEEEVVGLFESFGFGGGMGGRSPSAIFGAWDADGDGEVSREEFDARPRQGPG